MLILSIYDVHHFSVKQFIASSGAVSLVGTQAIICLNLDTLLA
jgi:hypothetical protein